MSPLMRKALAVAIVCGLYAVGAQASSPSLRARVIVRDVETSEALMPLGRRLADEMLLALAKDPELAVIGQRELELLAAHAGDLSAVARCSGDRSCLDALKSAVDVDRVLTAHLARFEAGFLLTLKVIDASRADAWHGDSCVAATEQEVLDCGVASARTLLNPRVDLAKLAPVKNASIAPARLAVLDLEALGVAPAIASSVTELLSLELKKLEGFSVIRPDEVGAMLDYEARKQIVQCKSDIACLLEIGGALGVEYLVGGAVGKLEDTWIIHVKLMDVARAEVKNRASESFRGEERDLSGALRFVALSLVGRQTEGQGSVVIEAGGADATVSVDGASPIALERFQTPIVFSAGKHAVSIRGDGYEPLQRDIYVEDRTLARVAVELTPIPTAWYEHWWVWTIVGAAAVATTGALIISRDDPPGTARVSIPAPGAGGP